MNIQLCLLVRSRQLVDSAAKFQRKVFVFYNDCGDMIRSDIISCLFIILFIIIAGNNCTCEGKKQRRTLKNHSFEGLMKLFSVNYVLISNPFDHFKAVTAYSVWIGSFEFVNVVLCLIFFNLKFSFLL